MNYVVKINNNSSEDKLREIGNITWESGIIEGIYWITSSLSLEELERLRIENKELKEEKYKLIYKCDAINGQHKKNLQEEYKKGYKEAERNLGLGFAVFDSVYRVKSDYKYSKCPKCDGNYKIKTEVLGKEIEVNCPHCNSGKVYKKSYRPEKDEVSYIKYCISKADRDNPSKGSCIEERNINIYLEYYDYEIKREEIYHTLEECQKVCDEMNLKEIINKGVK